jgi:hypothetical protein
MDRNHDPVRRIIANKMIQTSVSEGMNGYIYYGLLITILDSHYLSDQSKHLSYQ